MSRAVGAVPSRRKSMHARAFLVAALAASARAIRTDLTGVHLKITSVHDGDGQYINMLTPDLTTVTDSTEWTGFFVDMIDAVAAHAGFTYSLHAASGDGSRCREGDSPALKATQYGCAQDDVTELGTTDVYWALYYVTVGRSAVSRFTSPFLSDVGLSLLVKEDDDDLWKEVTKIFLPFTVDVWLLTVGSAVLVSLALWVAESSGRGRKASKSGFLTLKSARRYWPSSLASSLYALFSMDKASTKTRGGSVVNLTWCLFAVIWIATYTANLAQIMIVSQHNPRVSSLDEMNRRGLKACVKRGAAYANHMPELFPEIELVEIDPRFPKEAVDKLEDGDCDAYVDSSATLELLAGLRDNCDANLVILSVLRLFSRAFDRETDENSSPTHLVGHPGAAPPLRRHGHGHRRPRRPRRRRPRRVVVLDHQVALLQRVRRGPGVSRQMEHR